MTVETSTRSSPLSSWEQTLETLSPVVTTRELPFRTMLDLRLDPDGPVTGAIATVLGVPVPTTACTAVTADELDVLWLGPDEWLVVAPPGFGELEGALRKALDGHGAVVDVSAQRTTIHLSGRKARSVLAHGCSADLHPRVAGAGTCLQTHLAMAGVTLVVRDNEGSDYWLLVRSSFAAYLAAWLVDASLEYRDAT